jgi:hypothetical protein
VTNSSVVENSVLIIGTCVKEVKRGDILNTYYSQYNDYSMGCMIQGVILGRSNRLFVQISSGTHPTSYSAGSGCSFPSGKAANAGK